MKREAMLFYKSFDEAISLLPDDDQLKAYRAIIRYGLYGEDPDIDGVAGAIFLLAKPQIDANNRKYENGKRGGRPKKTENDAEEKQEKTEIKPKENLKETEAEPKEKDKEKDKVKDKKNTAQINDIFEKVWSAYPEKKGKARVSDKDKRKIAEVGLDKMLQAIQRYKDDVKSTTWRHWQNGSTFFHSGYIDYLDENYEKSNQWKPPNGFNNAPMRDCDMKELELKLLQSN